MQGLCEEASTELKMTFLSHFEVNKEKEEEGLEVCKDQELEGPFLWLEQKNEIVFHEEAKEQQQ